MQPFKVRPACGEKLDCLGGGLLVLQLGGQQTLLQAALEVARGQSLPVQPGARGGGRVQPVGVAEGIGGGLEVLPVTDRPAWRASCFTSATVSTVNSQT